LFQALVIVVIFVLSRRYVRDPGPPDPARPFDVRGAVLSSTGLVLVVSGVLAADDNLWLMAGLGEISGPNVLALTRPLGQCQFAQPRPVQLRPV
jgi:hypothetical protein